MLFLLKHCICLKCCGSARRILYTELLAACNGGSLSCDLVLIPTVPGTNSGGGKNFRTCPDGPWGPPSLLYNGYRVFPGGKRGRGVKLTTQPLLVPWSRKSRAIPLLPLLGRTACSRVTFTFTFTHSVPQSDTPMTATVDASHQLKLLIATLKPLARQRSRCWVCSLRANRTARLCLIHTIQGVQCF